MKNAARKIKEWKYLKPALVIIGILILIAVFSAAKSKEDSITGFDYAENAVSESSEEASDQDKAERKLVYTGDLRVRSDDLDKSYKDVLEVMKEYDAIFESVNETTYSKAMTIRIPQKKFQDFCTAMSDIRGETTYSSINIEDKTKTFTDNERRLDILESEYSELKTLLESAGTVEDVLSIKDRLSELTFEIESLKSDNKTINYDTEMATLNVVIESESTAIPFGREIKEAFSESIDILKDILLWIIKLWWVILIIVLFLNRKKIRSAAQKKTKKFDPEIIKPDTKGGLVTPNINIEDSSDKEKSEHLVSKALKDRGSANLDAENRKGKEKKSED